MALKTKFRECIIHIGTEKTGSTSLQTFLAMHRSELLRRGIFLPASLIPHGRSAPSACNHILLAAVCSDHFPSDLLKGETDHPGFRQRTKAAFFEEVEASDSPALLLTNEHLHSRITSKASIQRLSDLISPLADSVRVVVYLREQMEMAQSLFGLAVRAGATERRVVPLFDGNQGFDKVYGVSERYFDLKSVIDLYCMQFGMESVLPRLYRKIDSDIIDDFGAATGMDFTGLPKPRRQNKNCSAVAEDALLFINRQLSEERSPERLLFTMQAGEILAETFPGHGIVPDEASAEAFRSRFIRSNEEIRSRWFPEEQSLFGPPKSAQRKTDYGGQASDEAIWQVVVHLLMQSVLSGRVRHGVHPTAHLVDAPDATVIAIRPLEAVIDRVKGSPDLNVVTFELRAEQDAFQLLSPLRRSINLDDTRVLGICIVMIKVNGSPLVLGGAEFKKGFYEVEGQVGNQWIWTDGNAELELSRESCDQSVEIVFTDWHRSLVKVVSFKSV